MNKKIQKLYITLFFVCFFIFSFSVKAEAATKYWVGTAGGNMSLATNWSTTAASACGANANTTAPTSADDVEFTSSCTNSATLDQSFSTTINKLTINTGYTGTITQLSTNTITITTDFIMSAGTFTHTANTTAETYKVKLSVGGNFTLANGASINVDGKGFQTVYGTGKGQFGAGASYGGVGGSDSSALGYYNTYGSVYGSTTNPTNIGSGGGGTGANGGGAVILTITGAATINGTISANGTGSASGSGGTINITSASVTSTTGILRVNGGAAGGTGSGGGGRLAYVLTGGASTFPAGLTTTAYGGSSTGSFFGAAGTVYLQDGTQAAGAGRLIIDNNNQTLRVAQLTATMNDSINLNNLYSVTVRNKGSITANTGDTWNFSNISGSGSSTAYVYADSGLTVNVSSLSITNYRLYLNTGFTFNGNVTVSGTGSLTSRTTSQIIINGNFVIDSGGYVDHYVNATVTAYKLNLTVNGNFTINSGGIINVDGAGYIGTYASTGAGSSAGGTYGGIGGWPAGFNGNRNTYGSTTAPTDLGSGATGAGTNVYGGGAVNITVTGLSTINGTISSQGSAVSGSAGNGGSGGSIYITTGTVAATTGLLRVNGGSATGGNGGCGGGGRISVVLTDNGATFPVGLTTTAYGGTGSYPASAGTIYLQNGSQSAGTGTLTINNNNYVPNFDSMTLLPASVINLNSFSSIIITNKGNLGLRTNNSIDFTNANLTLSGRDSSYITIQSGASVTFPSTYTISNYTLRLDTAQTLNNLIISSTGRLSHTNNYQAESYKIDLTVSGDLTVESGGQISADSAGYAWGYGTGKATDWTGGTYGGVGGYTASHPSVNTTVYGSIIAPTSLGSPGLEGLGGGAIKLTVSGAFINNGSVTAIGQAVNSSTRGLGSGGSIYINTNSISGSGSISANGGQLTTNFGGGGGRVSVIITNSVNDFSNYSGAITARGGYSTSGGSGAAGTVYLRTGAQDSTEGTLIVDNNGYASSANSVTHLNSTVASGLSSLGQLVLGNLAKLTVNVNYPISFATTNLSSARPTIIASSTAVLTPNQSFSVSGTTDSQMVSNVTSYNVTYTGFPSSNTTVGILPGTWGGIIFGNTTSGITYRLMGNSTSTAGVIIPAGVTFDLNGYNISATLTNNGTLVYNGGSVNWVGEFGDSGFTVCNSTGNLGAGSYTNLTITNNSTCSLSANTTVSSLITINSGSTLYLNGYRLIANRITNAGTLKLKGDEIFTTSGTVTNNGTLEYVGNGNSTADSYVIRNMSLKNLKVSFSDAVDSLIAFYKTSTNGLIGWWKLDETATPAVDSSGYGSSGTWTNTPTVTTSLSSLFKFTNTRALTFITNKYVTLANPSTLNISYPITLSAWIKRGGTGTAQSILGHGTGSYVFAFDSSNKLVLSKRGGTSVTSTGTITDTSGWHHVAVSYNGSNASFYVDGVLSGSPAFSQSFSASVNLYIAGDSSAGEYFNGSIDDVRIYNRALSSDEIASLAAGYPSEGVANSSSSITGDYTQTAGTFISPLTLSLGGDFSQTGSSIFNPNSGTLSLTKSGGIQIITASSSLYNLSKTVSTNSTLKITAGSTLTTLATTTFRGTTEAVLSVESTNSGTQWKFDPRGNLDLAYMSVKDSNNINASTTNINPTINAGNFTGITDGGNNTNWLFSLPSLSLRADGNQIATTSLPATNQYLGGSFLATTTTGENVITSIRLKQKGSLPTSFISSLKIYYKDSVGGLCSNTSSLPVGSSLFGTAGAWSDNFATTTGSMTISATPTCIYIVFSLQGTLSLNTIYNTIDFEVANPSTDVISSGVTVSPATAVNIPGSTVVSGSISGVPAVSLSVSSTSVPTNSSVLLSWSTTKATNCSASASPANSNWTGAKDLSGSGVSTGPLTEHRVYSFALECSNSLGTSTSRVYVTAIHPLAPIITISTNPNAVASGASSTLTWSTAGNQNTPSAPCVASGSWLGNKDFSGNLSLSNITSTRYYTLTCANSYGSTSKTAAIIVNSVVPDYCTDGIFNGDETSVDYGGSCNSGDSGESVSNVSFGDFITLTMSDPTINPTVFYFMDDGVSNALYMRQGTLENTVIRKLTADGLNVKNGSFTKLDCGGSNDCRGVKIRLELEKSGSTSDLQNFVVEKTFQTTSFLRKK